MANRKVEAALKVLSVPISARQDSAQSADVKEILGLLDACVILAAEGMVSSRSGNVMGIAHDGSGFSPGATVFFDWSGSDHDAMMGAYEMLERDLEESPGYPEMLQEAIDDFGEDRADEILKETWWANGWKLSEEEVIEILKNGKGLQEFINNGLIDVDEDIQL